MLRFAQVFVLLLLLAAFAPGQAEFSAVEKALRARPDSRKRWKALRGLSRRDDAIRLARELLKGRPKDLYGWRILGDLAARADDYRLAVSSYKRSVALSRAQKRSRDEARGLARIWRIYRDVGAQESAIELLPRLRDAYQRAGLNVEAIDRMMRATREEKSLGSLAPIERYRLIAKEAAGKKDLGAERDALGKLSNLLHAKDNLATFEEGYACRRRVLEIDQLLGMDNPRLLGQDHNACARLGFEVALRLPSGPRRERLLKESSRMAEVAFALHEKLGGRELLRDHCLLAHVHQALGHGAEARKHFEEERRLVVANRAKISSISRESPGHRALRIYDGEVHHIYEDYGLFLAKGSLGGEADVEAALRTTEQGRVASLLELYGVRGRSSPDWLDRKLALPELISRLEKARCTVVVYLVGSHEVGVLAVSSQGLSFASLGGRDQLDRAAESFASGVFDPRSSRKRIEALGSQAFDAFLKPVWNSCRSSKRIILVGLSRYGQLPVSAFVTPGGGPLERRYLGASHELLRSPSIGCLLGTGVREAHGRSLCLSYGGRGPYAEEDRRWFGGSSLALLPGAGEEAARVARRLDARLLQEGAATEKALRSLAPTAPIIHLACHAVLDPRFPARSALLLAPSEADNGLLSLSEILGLDLGARLVVVSACSSARGEKFAGEGIRGLSRSFFVAGARFVLGSLAPVDDRATPRFLDSVMASLKKGRSVPEAVRKARGGLLARRVSAQPRLWAPFVLHGQAEELLR